MIFVVNFVECHYSNKASASTAAYEARLYTTVCWCLQMQGGKWHRHVQHLL